NQERTHEVHVFEAYWAPITEGRVTYWDTAKFLLEAGIQGLRGSRFLRVGTFQRWMVDGPKTMDTSRNAWVGIIGILIFLFCQLLLIGYVSTTIVQRYKEAFSKSAPDVCCGGFISAVFHWLSPLIPGHETLFAWGFDAHWWRALGCLILWALLILEVFAARYFL